MSSENFFIAQVGRTIGLHGDLKLHLHTDFPNQFHNGATLSTDRGTLTIQSYNPARDLVRFIGYESIDSAKKLTNTKLYSTLEQTKENCQLKDGQYFWFDIVGLDLYDEEELIGNVLDIDRMLDTDYLVIQTDVKLVEKGHAKDFLLPYIPRYIKNVDLKSNKLITTDAKEILEAS